MMSDEDGSRGETSKNAAIEEAASDWFALMKSDGCTARDAENFRKWIDADPRHQQAFQELEQIWELAGEYADRPEIQTMRGDALKKSAAPSARTRSLLGRRNLLSLALVAILITVFLIAIN